MLAFSCAGDIVRIDLIGTSAAVVNGSMFLVGGLLIARPGSWRNASPRARPSRSLTAPWCRSSWDFVLAMVSRGNAASADHCPCPRLGRFALAHR
jgi:hypothetical protein